MVRVQKLSHHLIMKIVFVQGGLGNQLFQYAFFRYLAKKSDENVYLDATAPFISKHGGFEIKKVFPATSNDKRILPYWKARPFFLAGDILKKILKINLQTAEENPIGKKIWWKAHWQKYQYAEFAENELREILQFTSAKDVRNQETLAQLSTLETSVSIHIRRGDYLQPQFINTFGNICTLNYYQKAIDYISQKIENVHFFIFSDDQQWVKKNLSLQNAVYVDWNTGTNSFRDMQLMSACKHHIIANSSFSWWGAWLNPNKEKIVVCPQKWFHNYPIEFTEELLPPQWHRVNID